MKRRLLVLALLSSCGPLTTEVVREQPLATADAGPQAVPDAGAPDAGPQPIPDAGPALTGLPCDVRGVLEAHCTRCHNNQTYAPLLTTRAHFLAQRINSTQLVGQFALQRMQPGVVSSMPPYGSGTTPSAADVAVIAAWVNAGMPGGSCGDAH